MILFTVLVRGKKMVKKDGRANYTAISIPKELIEEIKKLMKNRPDLQYRSIAEFTKAAIRVRLHVEKVHAEGEIKEWEKLADDIRAEVYGKYEKLSDDDKSYINEKTETINKKMDLSLIHI